MVRGKERRKERIEARKKKEAAAALKIFSGTDQLTAQMMQLRNLAPFQDGKRSAVAQAALKDPPLVSGNNGGSIKQQNGVPATPQGTVAAGASAQGITAASVSATTNGSFSNGMSTAAQGMEATAAGIAAMIMNKEASVQAPSAEDANKASSVAAMPMSDTQSAAVSERSIMSKESSSDAPMQVDTVATMFGAAAERSTPAAPSDVSAPGTITANQSTSTARDDANEPAAAAQSDDTVKSSKGAIQVKALNEDGVLDMYTYHRGREGMEPRDDETGELLCDVEPTDTNHGWEPPSMKISINIDFPLSDGIGEANNNGESTSEVGNGMSTTRRQAKEEKQDCGPLYTETIEWDLADPKTMTPLCFAASVSEEFGLDAGQTLDLAESIQKQINYFVQNKVSYKTPLTLLDANGNERVGASAYSPNMRGPPQLFGSAIGETKAGMPIPQKLLQTMKTARTPGTSSQEPIIMDGVSRGNIEPEYRDEVLRRARQLSMKDIAKRSTQECPGGLIGVMEEQQNGVCHSCTSRRSRTFKLACRNPYHSMCSRHVTVRSLRPK